VRWLDAVQIDEASSCAIARGTSRPNSGTKSLLLRRPKAGRPHPRLQG
jgi:hypothetical protein